MEYAITVRTAVPFADAAAKVREALKEQGFGVLTDFDMQATMREKLGEEMEPYIVLGACNPPLAHRAIVADRAIGLLLPCNVIVRAANGETVVQALDPRAIAEIAGQPVLREIADEAASMLTTALRALPPGDRPLAKRN
jgi:uncharacterized protein (DUF302 family)